MKRVFLLGVALVSLFCFKSPVFAADGFGASATGGAGGETVTVSNAEDFQYYVESDETYIVQVSGTIDLGTIGGKIRIHSNKTIKGIDSDPTIMGNLAFQSGASNVIIERLNITNPDNWGEGDGITIKYATNIFVTKCTFYDCPDGCIDITRESDYITVSWCKFYYTFAFAHRYVNLIGGDDSHTDDMGKLHITFHHNWWSTLCDSRMPSARYGRVHIYNNYYDCPGNSYCIAARLYSECLIENNYFDHVNNPYSIWISSGEDGKIGASGNIFESCGGYTDPGDDVVFTPPYSYTLDSASDVPSIVMTGAGAPQPSKVYYVDASATGLNNGTSWANAYNHLQDAMASASFNSEIWVAQGIYTPAGPGGDRTATFQLKNFVSIYGGFPAGGGAWEDRDLNVYETILSGDLNGDDGPNFANNGENSYHVVIGSGTNATAILDGFIITAGNASISDIIEGTISHWRFNEGSGSTVYDSIGSNNGYISGAQWAGGALEFDGVDDYVDVADSPTLNVTDGITIGMWIKPYSGMNCDERNNWRFLLDKNVQDWGPYNLIYEASWDVPLIGFTIMTVEGSEYRLWTNRAAYPDEFVYLAFTYDAQTGKQKTYFNGNLDSQQTTAGGSINTSSTPLRIGGGINTGCPDGAGFFKGLIDEVAIYDRALSAEEIQSLYHIGRSNGGGMYNYYSSPTVASCTFNGNSAEYGGGMCNDNSSPTLEGCTFSGNSASDGGGMYNDTGSPTVTNCSFTSNSAYDVGGGMYNYECSPTLTNCTFNDNSSSGWGGGMRNSYSSPTVTNCTFIGNWANSRGGGMRNYYNANPTLTNCMFIGNRAEQGGGVWNNDSSPMLTNCTFTGNSAYGGGGGMYNYNSSPTVTNCILWADVPSEIYGGALTVTYSDVQSGWPGTGNIDADPMFVNPGSNDYHLSSNSPCINAGDPSGNYNGQTDIDGELRVMLGRVDMGADEFNPFEIEFIVVNKRRIGRTIFEYDCNAYLHNISLFDVENIQLEIVKTPENMKIIDPNVTFGNIEVRAGELATSIDTCTFEVDRSQAIEPAEIIWWISCDLVAAGQTIQHSGSSIVFLEEDVISGDLTGEGRVDFADLAVLAEQWLGPPGVPSADIAPSGGDGIINFLDFAELAENWQGHK